ncbi:ESX secretion-associated protein EspG [Streptomyces gardneri]|uniref:ESX secretion-associated protein EspG n=1 Tax=Nocardia TaxID=1817 RepID=UPI00135A30C2|nr:MULTISPECIES: ESX secretion-associated protein EspG [Nocardia]MBF6167399.1 ESX secretion-associated protein EspG [Streptomyces gardneri]MBF6204515.1 ESX secretion-associated protein EspG [Streptomyces gardneri]UAK33156.1 ESX secretion-associated protein EspG [Nocardia asteroides]
MTSLTNDALLVVTERLGVQTLPLALSVAPQQDSIDEYLAAQEHALAGLIGDGLLDAEGEVESELAAALFVLAQPDRELVARIYTEDGPRRFCLARRGEQHALAVRSGECFEVRSIWADGSDVTLAGPLLAALGSCEPAEIAGFSALAADLADRLDAAEDSSGYADAMYALGVGERDAAVLGLAFGSCRAYAEIVAYSHQDGLTSRAPGAVAVYDTGRGRIVVAPMVSPDQQIWSTVTTGTDHRVTQAVATLLEGLPGGRWLPP